MGGHMNYHPPSASTDGDPSSSVYTEPLPWAFVAVDLEDTYEITSVSLETDDYFRKLIYTISSVFISHNTRMTRFELGYHSSPMRIVIKMTLFVCFKRRVLIYWERFA